MFGVVSELKQAIVAACLEPGASVAGVALAHGVNANLVRKWIAKSRRGQTPYGHELVVGAAGGHVDSGRIDPARGDRDRT
jgi:transposase-like protein